jgi:hypothetical protein
MRRHGRNALRRRLCQRDPPARENAAGVAADRFDFRPSGIRSRRSRPRPSRSLSSLGDRRASVRRTRQAMRLATGRGLPQRTEQTAHHDRIHHSKNTERHSALAAPLRIQAARFTAGAARQARLNRISLRSVRSNPSGPFVPTTCEPGHRQIGAFSVAMRS